MHAQYSNLNLSVSSVLGVKINQEANQTRGEEILLSTKDSKVPVWIVPTNEELAIARETARLVK